MPCCGISSFFSICAGQDAPRVRPESPADACSGRSFYSGPHKPVKTALQRGNQTQLFLTHMAFSHSGMRRAIYTRSKPCLRCSFAPPPPLGVVINMLTVNQFSHHRPLTAVHLLLIYGRAPQAAISAALFPRVPRPHTELARP